jgi:ribosome maturation factor RimP
MSVAERVRRIVEPLLVEQGLECFDVEFGGGRLVVMADRPGGVDLDALTEATRRISVALDQEDPVPGRYLLEVSSPGLERRLRTPAHFERFVGATISVKVAPSAEGARRVTGRLDTVDDSGIIVDGRSIAFDDIERAQTVFEWGPSPKPGKPNPGKPNPGKPNPGKSNPGKPNPAKLNDPNQTKLNPTKLNPTKLNPTKLNPTKLNPTKLNPSEPDPSEPDPSEPNPSEPGPGKALHRDQKAPAS